MENSYQGGVYGETTDNFQQFSENIASNIKKISQNVSSMSKMVNQLQTPQDTQELQSQLRQIQNYTQKMAKDTSSMLMELMKMTTSNPSHKLVRDRLNEDCLAALNAFQTVQRTAAQKSKEDVKKAKALTSGVVLFGENEEHLIDVGGDGDGDERGSRKAQQLMAQRERERELRELEERERDVRLLESDIVDVNQIFKELGAMIHEQGSAVESIEAHVERAAHGVEAGARELRGAASHKNSSRKKKVYIAIILIIIISIIIILASR